MLNVFEFHNISINHDLGYEAIAVVKQLNNYV